MTFQKDIVTGARVERTSAETEGERSGGTREEKITYNV